MKKIILIVSVLFFVVSCSTTKITKKSKSASINNVGDVKVNKNVDLEFIGLVQASETAEEVNTAQEKTVTAPSFKASLDRGTGQISYSESSVQYSVDMIKLAGGATAIKLGGKGNPFAALFGGGGSGVGAKSSAAPSAASLSANSIAKTRALFKLIQAAQKKGADAILEPTYTYEIDAEKTIKKVLFFPATEIFPTTKSVKVTATAQAVKFKPTVTTVQ